MIFVTGGGGGLSPNNAVIHVNILVGSTVTFAKGGVTVKVLDSSKGHANSDGETADYYYSVSSSNFGAWTVTATLNDLSATQTITVDAVKQYDLVLTYLLYLYKYGTSNTGVIGSWNQQKYYCNVSFTTDRITFTQTASQGHAAIYTNNKISLAKRTTLCVDSSFGSSAAGANFGLTSSIGNYNPTYVAKHACSGTGRTVRRLNISGYSNGSYYIVLNFNSGSQIFQVWLE